MFISPSDLDRERASAHAEALAAMQRLVAELSEQLAATQEKLWQMQVRCFALAHPEAWSRITRRCQSDPEMAELLHLSEVI